MARQKRYSKEEINELMNVSIVDYASSVLNMQLSKVSSNSIQIIEYNGVRYDSAYISPKKNRWSRFSDDGAANSHGDIFNFIQYWEGCSFGQAVQKVDAHKNGLSTVVFDQSEVKRCYENMPDKNDSYKRMYSFLMKARNMEVDVVRDWIKAGHVYESKEHNEVVFPGYFKGKALFTTKVSTTPDKNGKYSKFHVEGSMKECGIYHDNKADTLMVFEAPLDCMAYQSMMKLQGLNYKDKNYLIVCGVMGAENCLNFNMAHHGENITKIIFAMDNDKAGLTATKICLDLVQKGELQLSKENKESRLERFKNCTVEMMNVDSKDWNDSLNKQKLGAASETTFNPLTDNLKCCEYGIIENDRLKTINKRVYSSMDKLKEDFKTHIRKDIIEKYTEKNAWIMIGDFDPNTFVVSQEKEFTLFCIEDNKYVKYESKEKLLETKTQVSTLDRGLSLKEKVGLAHKKQGEMVRFEPTKHKEIERSTRKVG